MVIIPDFNVYLSDSCHFILLKAKNVKGLAEEKSEAHSHW